MMSRSDLDHLKEKRIRNYDQGLSALARTEKSIEELLADSSIPDDEKLKAFTILSAKFEHLHPTQKVATTIKSQTIVQPTPIVQESIPVLEPAAPMETPEALTAESSIEPAAADVAESDEASAKKPTPVLEKPKPFSISIPKQYHPKYNDLTKIVFANPSIINRAASGELIFHNILVPNSSFHDLLRESYIHSGSHNTVGQILFLNALHELNIDSSLISNSNVRNSYTDTIDSYHSPSASPTHSQSLLSQQSLLSNRPMNLVKSTHVAPLSYATSSKQSASGPPPGKRPRVLLVYCK